MTDPVSLYSNLLDAMRAENEEVTLKLFDPDFVIHEDPGMPYGGEMKGGAAFLRLRSKVYATWGPDCLNLLFKTGDGGEHAHGFFRLIDSRPGKPRTLESYVSLVWTFRNGLAKEVHVIYYDTPRLSKALAQG
jgi:hypothetical protein